MFGKVLNCMNLYSWILLFFYSLLSICSAIDCPNTKECVCQNDIIDCRGKGSTKLTSVPTFVSSTIPYRELDLCGNNIQVIHNNAFASLQISKLNIKDNSVISFDINAFAGITSSLTKLSFDLNENGQFPNTSQNALSKVTELNVTGYRSSNGHLEMNSLRGYRSLVSLTIMTGTLSQLVTDDFKDQEDTLIYLDISENEFTDIPALALSKLTKLDTLVVNHNRIMVLKNTSFSGLTLKALYMSVYTNLIIQSGSFLPIHSSLTYIRMQSCQLRDQSMEAFRTLTNLNVLELPTNLISNLLGLFDKMEFLVEANLEYNTLDYLGKESFNGVGNSLTKLRLSCNRLNSLDPNAFQMLKSLKELYMEDVPGTRSLNEFSFNSQRDSLKVLSIESPVEDSSQVKQSICPPWKVFNQIRSLESLNLKGCRMGNIPNYTFHLTNKLGMLNLESNGIDSLSMRALAGLEKSLQNLYLRSNHISFLDPCVLRNFVNLRQLQMAENPLQCDCNIIWLNKLFNASLDYRRWMCSNLKDTSFQMYISDHQVSCNALESSTTESPCYDWNLDFTTQITPSIELRLVSVSNPDNTINLSCEWVIVGISERDITGFYLTRTLFSNKSLEYTTEIHDHSVRLYVLKSLASNTKYTVCIGIRNSSYVTCLDATTDIMTASPITNYLWIYIIASVVGFLVIFVCCIACCCMHHRRKVKSQPTKLVIKQTTDMPQLARGTKRFVKPDLLEGSDKRVSAPMPAKSLSIADQLDTLTEDARYKFITLLNQAGGSMASLDHLDYSRSRRGTLPYGLGASSKSVEYLGNSYSLERRPRRPSEGSAKNVYNEIDDEVYDEIDV